MISRLTGTALERTSTGTIVVDCNGVGYEVIPTRRLSEQVEIGIRCSIVVFTDVKEDSIRLFGFSDTAEREVFHLLLRVTGIGTKTAKDIISGVDPQTLLRAIGQADISRLQAIRGVGKKTAERIVLELRDLVAQFGVSEVDSTEGKEHASEQVVNDAVEALVALGFGKPDASRAVRAAAQQAGSRPPLDSGKLVAEALRFV